MSDDGEGKEGEKCISYDKRMGICTFFLFCCIDNSPTVKCLHSNGLYLKEKP